MIIKRGKINDATELFKLLNNTSQLQSGTDGKTYSMDFVKACLTDKERDLVLIAQENNKIIGFLIAEIWKKKKYSFILDVFVKPEYRGKRIASKLKKEHEKICKNYKLDKISALVLVSNKLMQKILEKKSYKKGNKFYYYDKKIK